MTTGSTPEPSSIGWLITEFVRQVPGVAHAVVVSADGLLLVKSQSLPRDRAHEFSAISSGLISLTQGASKFMDAGLVKMTVVEMELGTMFLMSVSDGSHLAVLAAPTCEVGLVSFEMTLLVARVGEQMTPEVRAQLRSDESRGRHHESARRAQRDART